MTTAAADGPTVTVNDRPHPLAAGATLSGILADLGFGETRGIAAAVNGAVVPRSEWAARSLAPGDRLLVIRATQGG